MAANAHILLIWALYFWGGAIAEPKKNVLFLVSDDMRPQINAWEGPNFPDPNHPKMHTPNLDALASRSLVLERAYCQFATCSPSRSSLLTGRRPDTTHVYDLITYFRKVGGNYTTIPQYFKEHGYLTAGMGKIFHPGKLANNGDDPISWTEPYFHTGGTGGDGNSWTSIPKSTWEKAPLQDQNIKAHALKTLQQVAPKALSGEQPFFVAVGFHRPHLPFVVPDKYFDYYPMEDIQLPPNPYTPSELPQIAWSTYDEIRVYKDIRFKYGYGSINSSLPDFQVKDMRRAYYAAVTYIDDLIGEILTQLESLGLRNSTIVSFWGDHGWQLGEHGEWAKHTNFEMATHAPMMVSVPGLTDDGIHTDALTEFVDLFPSLAEAADLPAIPLCPAEGSPSVETCTEGVSFIPLAKNGTQPWKAGAFSQFARRAYDANPYMGYTMKTDRYRYTEWPRFHFYPEFQPVWDILYQGDAVELYDHKVDPQENHNVAHHADYKDIAKSLKKQLHEGWRAALPKKYL